jgi:hypothetical protein
MTTRALAHGAENGVAPRVEAASDRVVMAGRRYGIRKA